jgi:GntR family transcriptional regulator
MRGNELARGPLPLHYRILQIIRSRIASGEYPVGTKLPTEVDFTAEFGVSRNTVRTALQTLVTDGLIERSSGRGTFVRAGHPWHPYWAIRSVDDLVADRLQNTNRVLSAELVVAEEHFESARDLVVPPGDRLFLIRTMRLVEEGPYAYARIYLPEDIGARLPADGLAEKPIIQQVEQSCQIPTHHARQRATACAANHEIAGILDVEPGTPLLLLNRTYYTREQRPIEQSYVYYRPDRYSQVIDLFRRGEFADSPE